MTSHDFSYHMLANILDDLQHQPIQVQRPTIFQILRYQRKEHAYSNILAYFLDKEADHALNTLFLQSLISCAYTRIKERDLQVSMDENGWLETIENSSYLVLRESMNIDILIQPEPEPNPDPELSEEDASAQQQEWAILIENKIDHHLHNPLNDYWDSVHADHKLGIVLAPNDFQIDVEHKTAEKVSFVAITYGMFQKQILRNLPEFLLEADERGLHLCKDFLTTIDRLNHQAQAKSPIMEENIVKYREHKAQIDELQNHINQMREYIIGLINGHMESMGFSTYTERVGASRKYYPADESYKGLGTYIEFDTILNEGQLHMAFELLRGYTHLIEPLREQLQAADAFPKEIPAGIWPAKTSHALIFWLEADLPNKDIKEALDEWFGYINQVVSKTKEIFPTIRPNA